MEHHGRIAEHHGIGEECRLHRLPLGLAAHFSFGDNASSPVQSETTFTLPRGGAEPQAGAGWNSRHCVAGGDAVTWRPVH